MKFSDSRLPKKDRSRASAATVDMATVKPIENMIEIVAAPGIPILLLMALVERIDPGMFSCRPILFPLGLEYRITALSPTAFWTLRNLL
jgi:hypothetical protein